MEIVIAGNNNLIEITYLIYELTHFSSNSKGNHIFCNSNKYPSIDELKTEINNKNVFILKDKRSCIAIIILNSKMEIVGKNVNWQNLDEKNFLAISHILIHPYMQNKGLEKKLLDFAIDKAKELKCMSIRMKINGHNKQCIDICVNTGFIKTGECFYSNQEISFLYFEKII